jgi:hypothetical protein
MDAVLKIPRTDLEKLVLLAAQKNKDFHDFLLVNLVENEDGEKELFEEAKADLEVLFRKRYKGFSEELQMANMLAACHKRINEFGKVCDKKELELELILYVLKVPFSLSTNMFCTCFTKYNYRVVLLVKRAVTLLNTKLHEDYRIEFEPTINSYLDILHHSSSHLDFVNTLPKSI